MSTRKRRRGSNVNKGQLELQTLIEKFELYHWSAGHTAKTVRWHNQALGLFLNWLRAEGISTRQDDLGEDEAMAFVRYLRMRPGNKGLAARDTVNNRVRSLRAFFNWLYRKGYTDTHRLEDLDVPKTTQKEIEILTDEEIARIFGSFDTDALLGAKRRDNLDNARHRPPFERGCNPEVPRCSPKRKKRQSIGKGGQGTHCGLWHQVSARSTELHGAFPC